MPGIIFMKNFWSKLKKPRQKGGQAIYALAPMAGVTDSAFRQICKSFGADVVYSEMASATALAYAPKKTLELLQSDKKEAPYVIQLFGSNPKHFEQAVKLLTDKKQIAKLRITNYQLPQGIDINFGCPVKKVQKQGAGAVLMDNKRKAREIMKTVINNTDLPVSIKTRTAVGKTDVLEFLEYINDLDIKAIMIHGRTFAQGFSGPIDIEIIKKARKFFNGIILANGGVGLIPHLHLRQGFGGQAGHLLGKERRNKSMVKEYAEWLLDSTKADGIGIARGAMGRPWIFKAVRTGQDIERSPKAIYKVAIKHAELVEKQKGEQGIVEMRKHLCAYVQNLPGARKMRERLVKVNSLDEIRKILQT